MGIIAEAEISQVSGECRPKTHLRAHYKVTAKFYTVCCPKRAVALKRHCLTLLSFTGLISDCRDDTRDFHGARPYHQDKMRRFGRKEGLYLWQVASRAR